MFRLGKIFLYFVISLLLGALVAPWVYQGVRSCSAAHFGFLSAFVTSLQQMPFHRYLSRSVQVIAIFLFWPTMRWLHIRSLTELSLHGNNNAKADFFYGVAVALMPLWLAEIFFMEKGWYLFNGTVTLSLIFKLVTTAVAVSLFEEFFFRGVLLGLSRPFLGDRGALFLTAFLFAGVHFLNMPHVAKESVAWWSGLATCTHLIQGLPAMPLFLGAFASLFILGAILAWVTLRTSSLWLAIGLHGAWIFGQQSFNQLAHYAITPPNALLPWIGMPQIYGMVPVGLWIFLPLMITVMLLARKLGGALSQKP